MVDFAQVIRAATSAFIDRSQLQMRKKAQHPRKMAVTEVPSFLPLLWDGAPGLTFQLAGADDAEDLAHFLIDSFFADVPITTIIGLDVIKEIQPWIGDYLSYVLRNPFSIIVRDTQNDNRIAAVSVNHVYYRNPPERFIGLLSFKNEEERPNWSKVNRLLHDLHQGVGFDDDSHLSMDLVGVRKEYGGRGLAIKCVELSLELARHHGIRMVTAEVVNAFLAKGVAKLGFVVVKEINYHFYVQDGVERPFATDGIHHTIRMVAKKIDN